MMNDRKDTVTREIDRMVDRLPQDIAPPTELWPKISTAIVAEAAADDDPEHADSPFPALPAEISPPDDLWPGIASKLEHRSKASSDMAAPRYAWTAIAASVALAAIVGLTLLRVDGTDASLFPGDSPDRLSAEAIDDLPWLAADVADPDSGFAPLVNAAFDETRRTYVANIAEVRNERARIENSLARHPDDPRLRELWLHAYETELLLIDEASRVLTTI